MPKENMLYLLSTLQTKAPGESAPAVIKMKTRSAKKGKKSSRDMTTMEEIEILPRSQSPHVGLTGSPDGVEYTMSIRDYQSLGTSSLKVNRKATNRIQGNRKRSPSERDRDEKRLRALNDLFSIISEQEYENPEPLGPSPLPTRRICRYEGRDIPYTKRQKR